QFVQSLVQTDLGFPSLRSTGSSRRLYLPEYDPDMRDHSGLQPVIGIHLGGTARLFVGGREVVAADERVGVVGPELRLPLLQRRLMQRDRLSGAAGVPVGRGEVVAAGEGVGVFRPEGHLVHGAGLREGLHSPVVQAQAVVGLAQGVEQCPPNLLRTGELLVKPLGGARGERAILIVVVAWMIWGNTGLGGLATASWLGGPSGSRRSCHQGTRARTHPASREIESARAPNLVDSEEVVEGCLDYALHVGVVR